MFYNKNLIGFIFCCFLGSIPSYISAQQSSGEWVNDQLATMTLDEKIGQLFMIRAHSDKGPSHINQVKKYIKKYKVGGLCFFQGTPEKQAQLTNEYQQMSDIPLMISIDGEWGLGMRFPKSTISFPRAMTMGAIQDKASIYKFGQEVGKELRRLGIHVNFAPVVDVNNNASNPVINNRSFGENKLDVVSKAFAYMQGMESENVMSCAKHFPGHGDTAKDSHYELPIINHSRARLDSIELFPFQMLIEKGLPSIMIAHLMIPALDNRPNRPTTLSKNVVTDLLRKEMGFDGLIFTDAMEMEAVNKHYAPGEADYEAFMAGNDIILLPVDLPIAFAFLKNKIKNSPIALQRLNDSVKRILVAKSALNLEKHQYINTNNLLADLNTKEALALKSRLIQQSLTLVTDKNKLVPLQQAHSKKILNLCIGGPDNNNFSKRIKSYIDPTQIHIGKSIGASQKNKILTTAQKHDLAIVSIHDMSKYEHKEFGIPTSIRKLIQELNTRTDVLLILFGSPYATRYFESIPHVLVAYEDDEMFQDITAQSIFGANEINGKLPVSASEKFRQGVGIYRASNGVLGYASPEAVGMSSDTLMAIDTIVAEMIRTKAAPGCQIMVVKDGKIVFDKAYGHHKYDGKRSTKTSDIYDLASITKIMATTLSMMKMQDQKTINIYNPIKQYLTEIDTSNKANLIIEDILAHHAGLPGWIPYYAHTLDTVGKVIKPSFDYYRSEKSDSFPLEVAHNLYLRDSYQDSIWSRIYGCQLRDKRNYKYSDLGMYMIHKMIYNVQNKGIDKYVDEQFYQPLGLKNIGYKPLERFEKYQIPPTENDTYFRNQIVHGYVHDMGAAMLGGVSGHAGLFSNSYDLAVLMQMLLNGGNYGGKQYLKPRTIAQFTKRYYRSTRRGIGFDMKELNPKKTLNMSEKASDQAFGHLGFTGTAIFADPKHELIYIFLSNRTFPSMKNNKFGRNEYRPRVQTVVYNAIKTHN